MTTQTAATLPGTINGPQTSLLTRAKQHDPRAIATMFRQFVPEDEEILAVEFLGTQGVWGLGTHSFACVTNRRVAALKVRLFGEIAYQDGTLEHVNSAVIYQPSKLVLYLYVLAIAIATFGIGLLLLPLTVRLFYSFKKSGLVLSIREGMSVYIFSDRKLLARANGLYRTALAARERRASDGRAAKRPAYSTRASSEAMALEEKSSAHPLPPYPAPDVLTSYSSHTASRALAWLGAALLAIAVFLPYASDGTETMSILDTSDWNSIWFALEPLLVAVAIGFVATKLLGRRTGLAPGLLLAFGVQSLLLFGAYVGLAISGDYISPALGGWVGIAGAGLLVIAGLTSQSAQPTWTSTSGQAP